MTVFGVLWILALLFSLFLNEKYIIVLTLLSACFQCSNVFVISGSGIGPQVITSICFIGYMFFKSGKIKLRIKRRNNELGLVLPVVLIFVSVLISAVINNTFSEKILRIIQLLSYVVCFLFMYRTKHRGDEWFVYKVIRGLTVFLLVMGAIQIGITSGIIPRLRVITELFYNDTTSEVIYFTRNNYHRILSTFMEPSYYASFIAGAFYYFLVLKDRRKENYLLLVVIGLELILTFSSTAYGAILVVGIIALACLKEGRMRALILVGGGLGLVVMYFGFYSVLDEVVFSKMKSGSGVARSYWNIAALRQFNSSPIFGVGYKNARASNIIYTLLAEEGIIGLINYGFLVLYFVRAVLISRFRERYSNHYYALCFSLLAVFASQIIGVPDIDICTLWLWLNILALSSTAGGGQLREIRR